MCHAFHLLCNSMSVYFQWLALLLLLLAPFPPETGLTALQAEALPDLKARRAKLMHQLRRSGEMDRCRGSFS